MQRCLAICTKYLESRSTAEQNHNIYGLESQELVGEIKMLPASVLIPTMIDENSDFVINEYYVLRYSRESQS